MRSLLFVPADGGSKLEKAMASGTDAVIIDLEDSITPERKSFARAATLEFLRQASATKQRPRLLVRVNGLDTGMTDADLEAVVPGRPMPLSFPRLKARQVSCISMPS
jgi:citrate lyase subunit beta/citryl-CoA lyase